MPRPAAASRTAAPPANPAAASNPALDSLIIFGLALALRLLNVWGLKRSPFFYTLIGDGLSYDTWARQIASGDWLGTGVFYQTPLYPYFLGTLYSLGRNLDLVRGTQAFVGAGSCVLIGQAAQRFFGRRAGLAAGLILAVYSPAIFFDGLIQKPVIDVFLLCLSLFLVARLIDAPGRPAAWLGLGASLGALALTRENAVLFLAVVPVWTWFHHRAAGRQRLTFIAALFAGAALVLVPVGLRNLAVGGEFHLTTSQFGPNFFIGNGPRADGSYVALREGRGTPEFERIDATEMANAGTGRTLSPGEVSTYWTGRTLTEIETAPMRWIRLEMKKLWLVWSATESMDTESQEAYAEWSWVLRVLTPVAHFGILAPFAILGLWATRRDYRRLWLLYILIVTYVASVIVFYVLARYRYPLVPILVIFAAPVLADPRALLKLPGRDLAVALGLAAVIAVISNWPTEFQAAGMRAQTYVNLGAQLAENGDLVGAASAAERAVAAVPDSPQLQTSLGALLMKVGQPDVAIAHLTEAVRLHPDAAETEFNLAIALNNQKRYEEAIAHYRSVLSRRPDMLEARRNLAVSEANFGANLLRDGQRDRAMALFTDALTLAPDSGNAHFHLGAALLSAGDVDGAIPHLVDAVRLDASDVSAHYALGQAYRARGAFDLAIAQYRESVRLTPNSADAHNGLGIALGSAGQLNEAADEFREALRLNPNHAGARNNLAMISKR